MPIGVTEAHESTTEVRFCTFSTRAAGEKRGRSLFSPARGFFAAFLDRRYESETAERSPPRDRTRASARPGRLSARTRHLLSSDAIVDRVGVRGDGARDRGGGERVKRKPVARTARRYRDRRASTTVTRASSSIGSSDQLRAVATHSRDSRRRRGVASSPRASMSLEDDFELHLEAFMDEEHAFDGWCVRARARDDLGGCNPPGGGLNDGTAGDREELEGPKERAATGERASADD